MNVPAPTRTITAVPTSITAFIGRARRGPVDTPTHIRTVADFDRWFGGLWAESPLGHAVHHFFLNGGTDAVIVRVHNGAVAPSLTLAAGFILVAASAGDWGEALRVRVGYDAGPIANVVTAETPQTETTFNLAVKDSATGRVEQFWNLSILPGHPRYVATVLETESELVRFATPTDVHAELPPPNGPPADIDPMDDDRASTRFPPNGDDGAPITAAQISDPLLEPVRRGLWALDGADLVNMLCIPPLAFGNDVPHETWDAAIAYAKRRRAVVIVDPPGGWSNVSDVVAGIDAAVTRDENAAIYFPRIGVPDPLQGNAPKTMAACGTVAGTFARVDAQRGVWKAPAGPDATLLGVVDLPIRLTEADNAQLTRLGINALRDFHTTGPMVWGSRTLQGADVLASQWKYLPVRRLALMIEESVDRGTRWASAEANAEPLWSQLRLVVGDFLYRLSRSGAFAGAVPRDACFVKCDRDTTTQADLDAGVVNIVVGFAPLKPAEFVVIRIGQFARSPDP